MQINDKLSDHKESQLRQFEFRIIFVWLFIAY